MSESAQVLAELEAAFVRGETPVLATVVAVRGSSYRKPGARLVVSGGAWRAGSISGGCLEADVVRRAAWLVLQGLPTLVTFDTSADGDAALGCGGEVDVVLEPVQPDAPVVAALLQVVHQRVSAVVKVGEFEQTLTPSPRLVLCGAGHDVGPLLTMGSVLGWDLHVADWRPRSFTGARFQLLAPSELARLPLEAGCAVVVMAHHLLYDEAALRVVLASPLPAYVGVLGPRKRTAELLERLPNELSRERVHAPVGLDLGGEGPGAVALSIAAQVHQCFNSASPRGTTQ